MEDQVGSRSSPERVRIRKRVPRKRSLFYRIKKKLEMPYLKRHDRNQRLAIGAVLLLAVVYLGIVRPIMDRFFPPPVRKGVQIGPPVPRPAPAAKGR